MKRVCNSTAPLPKALAPFPRDREAQTIYKQDLAQEQRTPSSGQAVGSSFLGPFYDVTL